MSGPARCRRPGESYNGRICPSESSARRCGARVAIWSSTVRPHRAGFPGKTDFGRKDRLRQNDRLVSARTTHGYGYPYSGASAVADTDVSVSVLATTVQGLQYDLLHAAVPWPMLIAAYSTWLSPGQPAKNWSLIINTMSNDICI